MGELCCPFATQLEIWSRDAILAPSIMTTRFRKFFRKDSRSPSKVTIIRASTEPRSNTALYTPLRGNSKDIRLCRILRVEGNKIEVSFNVVPLAECKGKYRALSYAWGNEKDRVVISVNGHSHPVTRNLEYWLQRIEALGYGDLARLPAEDDVMLTLLQYENPSQERLCAPYLFQLDRGQANPNFISGIDALSINQLDIPEKEQQVSLMGPIYQGAKEVLIGVCEQLPRDDYFLVRRGLEGMLIDRHLTELDCFSAQVPPLTPDGLARNPFLALVQSPWFTRTWTVQEFCLGQSATLICPWGDVSWDVFVKAFLNWNQHVYCHIKSLEHSRMSLNSQHILQSILLFMHLDATDLRDKVYGLRALHCGSEHDMPAPRYEVPVTSPQYKAAAARVFTDFTWWAIRDVKGLFPLAFDLHKEGSKTSSWVMDLSMQPTIDANYWRRRLSGVGLHNASAGIPFVAELTSPDGLRVQGIQVGHIEAVTEPFLTLPECNADLVDVLRAWYAFAIDRQADSLLLNRVDSFMEITVFDDWFCRTMLANQVENAGSFRQAMEPDLAQWRTMIAEMMKLPSGVVEFTSVMESHMAAVLGRSMLRLDTGYVGISQASAKVGDVMWVLGGGKYL
ncbi:hypothetical protein LTR10_004393 [Elasticomyces elasticus]|nr:hypothetical protein LTR10_004393 [Elasticomyces elasticus]KAK4976710.1 hypothetical protein LTR42_002755 [Elasticomyces elasticus]